MLRFYDTKHQISLDKPEDWDRWIFFIKKAVSNPQIWKFIDPDLINKLVTTFYSKKVISPAFSVNNRIDAGAIKQYKAF